MLTRTLTALKAYKRKKWEIDNLTSHLKNLEKEQRNLKQAEEKMIKTKAETNKIENKKTTKNQ